MLRKGAALESCPHVVRDTFQKLESCPHSMRDTFQKVETMSARRAGYIFGIKIMSILEKRSSGGRPATTNNFTPHLPMAADQGRSRQTTCGDQICSELHHVTSYRTSNCGRPD